MLAVLLTMSIVLQSINIGRVIDNILLHHNIELQKTLLIVLGILILRSLLQSLIKLVSAKMSTGIKSNLRKNINSEHFSAAQQLNLSTEGIEGIDSYYSDYLPQLYRSAIISIGIIIFLFFFHRPAALIMLVTAPFIPIFYIIIGINTAKKAQEQMMALNQFSSYFLDAVRGIVTIKLFNYEERVQKDIEQQSIAFKDKTMTILKTAFLSTLMLEFISMLSIGIIALEIGLGLVLFHSISFYTAIVVLMLAPEFYNALKDLGLAFHTGKQAEGYASLLEQQTSEKVRYKIGDQNNIGINARIDFGHFKLDVDEDIPVREMVIFGASGAGKTTLARLLSGAVIEGTGEVTLPEELKEGIVYMAQQPFTLSDTIYNNVTMFNGQTIEQVEKAARQVGMHDYIMSLRNRYDTVIGEGGEQLSGGQTHRLMLMRVLLNPKPLIIFDEPTAMLDIETEQLIKEHIERMKQHSTIITIAHQRATILQAPYLLLMDGGKIVAQGLQEELHGQPFYEAVIK